MSETPKCSIVGGVIKPCCYMEEVLEPSTVRGFFWAAWMDLKTANMRFHAIRYRHTSKREWIIPVCPFCCEKLDVWNHEKPV